MSTAPADQDALGTDLVKLSLAAWPKLPNLVSDYLGPYQWLRESRLEPASLETLLAGAQALTGAAERAGDAYVAVQARAIAIQIEVEANPRRYGYVDLVQQLLACPFVEPDPEELDALAR